MELLSVGVPMITMGDEVRRTQLGNNNAYCQDSELSWFDWGLVERNAGLLRFTGGLIAARRAARALLDAPTDMTLAQLLEDAGGAGTRLGGAGHERRVARDRARHVGRTLALYVILNAYWEALDFELPVEEAAWVAGAGSSTRRCRARTTS